MIKEVTTEKKYKKFKVFHIDGNKEIELSKPIALRDAMKHMVKNGLVVRKGFIGVIAID